MKARFLVTIPVLALAFASGFACSSNDNNGSGGSGGSMGGTGGSMGGTGGSMGGTGGSMGGTGGSGPVDQCTNASDMAAVQASYDADGGVVDGGGASVSDIAQACGSGCLNDSDPKSCTQTCIDQRTNNSMSSGCSSCFVDTVLCGINNCALPCLSGDQTRCDTCLCNMGTENVNGVNCIDGAASCTGIPSTTCTDLMDAGTADGG